MNLTGLSDRIKRIRSICFGRDKIIFKIIQVEILECGGCSYSLGGCINEVFVQENVRSFRWDKKFGCNNEVTLLGDRKAGLPLACFFTKHKGIFFTKYFVESLNFFCSKRNDGSDRNQQKRNRSKKTTTI